MTSLASGSSRPVSPQLAEALALTAAALSRLATGLLPLLKPGGATRLPRALAVTLLRRASDTTPSPTEADLAIQHAEASLPAEADAMGPHAFHFAAVSAALSAHWAEVRRWDLPAADSERFVAQAQEHLRLLEPADLARNPMARGAIRLRVDEAIRTAVRNLNREPLRLLPLLLDGLGFAGGLHDGRLAEALEPDVVAAANVAAVLDAMAQSGECLYRERSDGRRLYMDPTLLSELGQSRQRELALERRLGHPQLAIAAPVRPEVQSDVDQFARRLAMLQALFEQGTISAEELATRRAEILREI